MRKIFPVCCALTTAPQREWTAIAKSPEILILDFRFPIIGTRIGNSLRRKYFHAFAPPIENLVTSTLENLTLVT